MHRSSMHPGLQQSQPNTTINNPTVDDWADYPKNLRSYDSFLYDAEQLQQQVRALVTSVFDTETEVDVLDANGERAKFQSSYRESF